MATSDYKNALTNMRNFILGGGYVAGTLSGKNINPETGVLFKEKDTSINIGFSFMF